MEAGVVMIRVGIPEGRHGQDYAESREVTGLTARPVTICSPLLA
jgi:hypothetical protein